MVSSPRPRRSARPRGYRPYPSDLSDEQWALIEPLVATASQVGPGSKGGRPPVHDRRRIVEAILYVNRVGCPWRYLPHDFPPHQTVFEYFSTWTADTTVDRVHDALRAGVRDQAGRDPMASAGVVDSQSVKSDHTVSGGGAPPVQGEQDPSDPARYSATSPNAPDGPGDARGYDGAKKINGRKRHLVVDTMGLLVAVLVTPASVQDRDGGIRVLSRAKTAMPSLTLVWADGAYSRRVQDYAVRVLRIAVEVVDKPAGQRGFAPLPRRWVVERTNAWVTAARRLARDYERRHTHAEAMVKWAMVGHMLRRLAPPPGRRPWSPPVTA